MVGESGKWEYGKRENGEKWEKEEKGKKEEAWPRGKVSIRGENAITKDKMRKLKEPEKIRIEICLNHKKNDSIL